MPSVIKWTEIESFHRMRQTVEYLYHDRVYPIVAYRAKVKLHGTNAGIQIDQDRNIIVQSRTTILSQTQDNMGFYKWVMEDYDKWHQWANEHWLPPMTIFGEWCGQGINKGTAISQVSPKILAVFAIRTKDDNAPLITAPPTISNILRDLNIPNVYVLPWIGEVIDCDFLDIDSMKLTVDWANKLVEQIEQCDPWVRDTFGIEGIGEGIVAYPVETVENLTPLMFKAKGAKHQVIKTKKPAQLEPSTALSPQDFANLVVTEARLQQAVTESCNGEYSDKYIGSLLKWINQDVQKECQNELTASGLEWKPAIKCVSKTARNWYLKKIRDL